MPLYSIATKDNEALEQHADIIELFDDQAARLHFAPAYQLAETAIVGWKKALIDDAWIKVFGAPDMEEDETTIFDGITCRVTPPGQHPGLPKQYWLTPLQAVYIPVFEPL